MKINKNRFIKEIHNKRNKNKKRIIWKYNTQNKKAFSLKNEHLEFLKNFPKKIFFSQNSFSFQKTKNIFQAIENHITNNSLFFYKIDISNFFDSINNSTLEKILKINIKDELLLRGLLNFKDLNHEIDKKNGLKQGLILSPLLSELYMKDFDDFFSEYSIKNNLIYTRYCDDILFSTNSSETFNNLFINDLIEKEISIKLRELELEINTEKTKKINLNEDSYLRYLGCILRKNKFGDLFSTISRTFKKDALKVSKKSKNSFNGKKNYFHYSSNKLKSFNYPPKPFNFDKKNSTLATKLVDNNKIYSKKIFFKKAIRIDSEFHSWLFNNYHYYYSHGEEQKKFKEIYFTISFNKKNSLINEINFNNNEVICEFISVPKNRRWFYLVENKENYFNYVFPSDLWILNYLRIKNVKSIKTTNSLKKVNLIDFFYKIKLFENVKFKFQKLNFKDSKNSTISFKSFSDVFLLMIHLRINTWKTINPENPENPEKKNLLQIFNFFLQFDLEDDQNFLESYFFYESNKVRNIFIGDNKKINNKEIHNKFLMLTTIKPEEINKEINKEKKLIMTLWNSFIDKK